MTDKKKQPLKIGEMYMLQSYIKSAHDELDFACKLAVKRDCDAVLEILLRMRSAVTMGSADINGLGIKKIEKTDQ